MLEARVDLLVSVGLTEAQARVYAALATLGTTTAREVSELAGVPRTRVYAVLKSLRELALVREEGDGLAAAPLAPYLEGRAAAAAKRRAALLSRRRALAEEYRPLRDTPPPGALRLVRGGARPAGLIANALRDARARVDASLSADALAAFLDGTPVGDALRGAIARVPDVRLVVHADAVDASLLEGIPRDLLLKARIAPRETWAHDRLVVDGERLLLRLAHAGFDGAPGEASEAVILTRHPGLVADATAVIEDTWLDGAVPFTPDGDAHRAGSAPDATARQRGGGRA